MNDTQILLTPDLHVRVSACALHASVKVINLLPSGERLLRRRAIILHVLQYTFTDGLISTPLGSADDLVSLVDEEPHPVHSVVHRHHGILGSDLNLQRQEERERVDTFRGQCFHLTVGTSHDIVFLNSQSPLMSIVARQKVLLRATNGWPSSGMPASHSRPRTFKFGYSRRISSFAWSASFPTSSGHAIFSGAPASLVSSVGIPSASGTTCSLLCGADHVG